MWVLILTLIVNSEPPAHVTTIANIQTQAFCEKAAKEWEAKTLRGYHHGSAVCVHVLP